MHIFHVPHHGVTQKRGLDSERLVWGCSCGQWTVSPPLVSWYLVTIKKTTKMIEKSCWPKGRRQGFVCWVNMHLRAVHNIHRRRQMNCRRWTLRRRQRNGICNKNRLRLLMEVCIWYHGIKGTSRLHSVRNPGCWYS